MVPGLAESAGSARRQPAVLVAVCFAAGIVLDRWVLGWLWWSWCLLALAAVAGAIAGWRTRRTQVVVFGLLASGVCLGGLRHHAFWSLSSLQDVSRFLGEESRLIRLRGFVENLPINKPPSELPFQSAYPQGDVTVLMLRCESLQDGLRFVPVQGKIQVRVTGKLSEIKAQDYLELSGWISRPFPPANPGDFDFGEYLKQQEATGVLRVQEPDAVQILPRQQPAFWRRGIERVRQSAEALLAAHLGEQNAKIAGALLLGIRSTLPEDVRLAFAESGMMHVLALSGLHVGILAWLVWILCRMVRLSPRASIWLMLAAVFFLAVISGGRPPIVRATVFLTIAALGRLARRQSHPHNILALAALVILVWNPSDLFDAGTQLSFLAVMGILMASRWAVPKFGQQPLAADESQMENRLLEAAAFLGRAVWQYAALMLGIWLWTAPLIAARFHLISPVGLLLNSVLIPLVIFVLWAGYLLLFFGGIHPFIASVFAVPLDFGLTGFSQIVQWGAALRLGHVYVTGPKDWWLAGYYLLLVGMIFFRLRVHRPRLAGAMIILAWTGLGLGIAAWPHSPRGLKATFLSVGHGSAILVEFPEGKTLLFDAGALDDGERAFQIIRTALWENGITRLDAVALSHADLDHVNALPHLIAEIPIGSILVSKSFFQSRQEVVPYLMEHISARNIPITAIGQADRLKFDDAVSVTVQHPDPLTTYTHSNANSLVLRLTFAERSLLLVGDVERDGLNDLMSYDSGQVDVLQAPHHGSRSANTSELARWANPTIVIVSGGDVPGRREELKTLYGSSARLLTTHDDGAVTVTITADSQLLVESHLKPSP